MTRLLPFLFVLVIVVAVSAQTQVPPAPPGLPVDESVMPPPRPMTAMQGVNPALLQRIQGDLNMELKQIQRALGFIDPQDAHLTETLKTRQAEVVTQLKDIAAQLKEAGIATEEPPAEMPATETLSEPAVQPILPNNPGLSLPSEVQEIGAPPVTRRPAFSPVVEPEVTPVAGGSWDVPPSKELVTLKQTVAELQSEIASMRQDIKALEAQIRLLNQNILLQAKTPQ